MDERDPGVERRKGGRPRVAEPLIPVTTWIPVKDHDRLIDYSNRCGQKVSETIRQVIILTVR